MKTHKKLLNLWSLDHLSALILLLATAMCADAAGTDLIQFRFPVLEGQPRVVGGPGCDFGGTDCADNSECGDIHTGIDYDVARLSPVTAANFGEFLGPRNAASIFVEDGSLDHGMGNAIGIRYLLKDGTYIWDLAAHLHDHHILPIRPQSYDRAQITKSSRLGLVGSTGGSWEPHLHYEMKLKPTSGTPWWSGAACNGVRQCWGYTCNDPGNYGYIHPASIINNPNIRVLLPDLQDNTAFGRQPLPLKSSLSLTNVQAPIETICIAARLLSDQTLVTQQCAPGSASTEQILSAAFSLPADDYTIYAALQSLDPADRDWKSSFRPIVSVLPGPKDVIRDNHVIAGADGRVYFSSSDSLNAASETADGYLYGSYVTSGNYGDWARWHPYVSGPYEIWAFVGGGGNGFGDFKIINPGSPDLLSDQIDFGGNPYRWKRLTSNNGIKRIFHLNEYSYVGLVADEDQSDRLLFDAIKFVRNYVGFYSTDYSGWKATSQQFVNAYERNGGSEKLGYPVSHNGGGEVVHWWATRGADGSQGGVWIQDLQQTTRDGTWPDGRTAIILHDQSAFLLKKGFWNYYMRNQGPANLGAPTSDEYSQDGLSFQNFSRGRLAWDPEAPGDGIGHYDLEGNLVRGHEVRFISSRTGLTVWNRGFLVGQVPATMTGCEGCQYEVDVELSSGNLVAGGTSAMQYQLTIGTGPMTIDLDQLIDVHPASGVILSPSGTQNGTINITANVTDAEGLARTTVTFVPGGLPLELCGPNAPIACAGKSQGLSRVNINPATYGASAGIVTLRLFVEDAAGHSAQVDSHSFTWSPPSPSSGHTLRITKLGSGRGTVSGTGIHCGPDCTSASATYPEGTQVTLSGSGDQFIGFMGNRCYGLAVCTFGMSSNLQISASFSPPDSLGVAYTYPTDGNTGVASSTLPSIYFNRSVQLGPSSGEVSLRRCDNSSSRTVTPAIGGTLNERMTLHGAAGMDKAACYEVTVPAGAVTDLEGHPLVAPMSFVFTTEVPGTPKMYVSAYPVFVREGSESKVSIYFETPASFDRVLNLTSTPAGTLIHPSSVVLPAGETLYELQVDSLYSPGSLADVAAALQVQETGAGTGSTNIVVFNTTASSGTHLEWLAAGITWDDDGDGIFESDERADILFEVANFGSQGISNVVLDFTLASNSNLRFLGTGPHTCAIGYLAPGRTGECSRGLLADDDLPTGDYYIKVHGSGTVGSATDHLYATPRIHVVNRAQPDYTLNASPFSTSPRQPGSLQTLRYHPRNSGHGFDPRLPKFEIFIEIDGQEHRIHSLHANARGDLWKSQTFDLPFVVPAVPGSHKIRARINADGAIPESNAANNEADFLTLNIAEPNQAPSLPASTGPFVIHIGQLASMAVTASDPNNNPLTYSFGPGAPAGLSIQSSTGLMTWTPDCTTPAQIYNVEVRVADPGGLTDTGIAVIDVRRLADLAITMAPTVASALPGQTIGLTIEVENRGPSCVTGATASDAFASQWTEIRWTCIATAGSTCTAGPVSGDLADSLSLKSGGKATYTVSARIADSATEMVSNEASVTLPAGASDPNTANNSATTSVSLRGLDFGDAGDGSLDPQWNFPTRLANDGARHGVDPFFALGATIDAEHDGQPDPGAVGDDLAGADDEGGVAFPAQMTGCEEADLEVTASAPGFLDAWIDFNGDGDWNDAAEQVFASRNLVAGVNALSFAVPCSAVSGKKIFARFRLSSTGGLSYSGLALDGEVEDYATTIWNCRPPASGDWIVGASCTFTGTAVAPASVIVEPGVVLTVEPGAVLEIDLHSYQLLVREGGGVRVRQGGTVRQTSGASSP